MAKKSHSLPKKLLGGFIRTTTSHGRMWVRGDDKFLTKAEVVAFLAKGKTAKGGQLSDQDLADGKI